jgi:ubiquinone/menaquinone biosynthesis C-methylase UbiE
MAGDPLIDEFVEYFTEVQASDGWRRALDAFARFVAPERDARVLDVGCGPGALVRRFAQIAARAEGCDSHVGMIERATKLAQEEHIANVAFRVGELPRLPYDEAAFDVVTATNVVFLQRDPAGALREMARVCRPGGWVAMLNPSSKMSVAAATAYIDAQGGAGFNRQSFINWAGVAERNHRISAGDIVRMFSAADLDEVVIEEKIGGLALFAKGKKTGHG